MRCCKSLREVTFGVLIYRKVEESLQDEIRRFLHTLPTTNLKLVQFERARSGRGKFDDKLLLLFETREEVEEIGWALRFEEVVIPGKPGMAAGGVETKA
ncbi:hypothetical protein HDU98_004300 [Podochytrium sp. JEL0797]|nr:hypothetical protein HDU98_004300 [Podochytrium sp. JEL0797]